MPATAACEGHAVDRDLLVAQYSWVRSVAHNLVRDRWIAEDVMQEAVLAALAAPPRHGGDAPSLRAWLGRVAFNLSRLGARQTVRRRAREERVARPEALPSVSDEAETVARLSALLEAVAGLDEPYRTAVELRYFDELSTAEIARRTGVSELAVRKRLWRARGKLRDALGHEGDGVGLFALLLPLRRYLRGTSPVAAVGAAAAALFAVAGSVAWSGRAEREPVEHASTTSAWTASVGSRDAIVGGPEQQETDAERGDGPGTRSRLVVTFSDVPPVTPPPPRTETAAIHGAVVDLEARPVAGLAICPQEEPDVVLAVSDALGAFRVPADAPRTLTASGPGFRTIAPAHAERASLSPLVVVAPAAPLAGRVVDERGLPLEGVELDLSCDDSAFVALDRPVRVDSPRLCSARTGADGAFVWSDAPRGDGLVLSASLPGFETATWSTRGLFESVVLVLRRPAEGAELCGTVRRADGTPAAGAYVRLSLATVRTDELGRYWLPLRGVQEDSVLEAWDEGFRSARIHHVGRDLLHGGVRSLDVVLDPVESVAGLLESHGDPVGGWRVFAFADSAAASREPAASTESSERGEFRFRLPAGAYSLVALEPDGPGLAQSFSRDTREGSWSLEVGERGTRSLGGRLTTDAGEALAGARLAVALSVDGLAGEAPWRDLVTDRDGRWSMEIGDGVRANLVLDEPVVGTHSFTAGVESAEADMTIVRPSLVRVLDPDADSAVVLDEDGHELFLRGATGTSARHALVGGRSPVLAVPAEGRWLSLRVGASEVARVRLALEPAAYHVIVR